MTTTTTPTRANSPKLARVRRPKLLLLLLPAVGVLLLFFIAPLGRLVTASFTTGAGFSLDTYLRVLSPDDAFISVLARTVVIALCVAAATVLLGYPIAYAAVRLPSLWGTTLIVLVCLPFFTSALVRTYAWRSILADQGPINNFLVGLGLTSEPIQLVYNDIGVVIGMTQVLLPMMIFPLYSVMRGIDPALTRAAQSMGSDPYRAWRTVFLPLSLPGLTSGFMLVFISALGYYITPVLLQGPSTPLFAQRIDQLITLPGQQGYVAAQAAIVLLLATIVMVVFRKKLGLVLEDSAQASPFSPRLKASSAQGLMPWVAGRLGSKGPSELGKRVSESISKVRWVVVGMLCLLGVAVALGPMIVIVMLGFSSDAYLRFPPTGFSLRWMEAYFADTDWIKATGLSTYVSMTAALVATVIAGFGAFAFARMKNPRVVVPTYLLLLAPMIVPQVILAVALLYAFIPFQLTGTATALIIAYTVIGVPLATVVLTTAFRGLDPQYERASASLGATPGKTTVRIVLPLVAPAIISALLFVFVTGFSDLVLAQFLGGTGAQTLERQMYRSIREEVSPQVAAVGTLLLAFIVLAGAALTAFRSRTGARP